MTCIDQEIVLNDRHLYSTMNVLYHALEKSHCSQPNGPSLTAITKYLQDDMDPPINLFARCNRQLFHNVHAMSENLYPLNVINTFFPVSSGIPESSQCCIEPIPAIRFFLFHVIFITVPSTTTLSLRSLFYNPFLSIKLKGLGDATKIFGPTITTTTTESTTINLTTEKDVHIQQQKMHKKTTEITQNPSVCFPVFLFGQITMWCLRGCMLEQCIRHSTTHAHTDYGFGSFSNHFLLVILSRIKGVCCLENKSIGQ